MVPSASLAGFWNATGRSSKLARANCWRGRRWARRSWRGSQRDWSEKAQSRLSSRLNSRAPASSAQEDFPVMRPTRTRWMLSSILLAAAGAILIIAGLYFLLLRPALLPEDIRYMQLAPAELAAVRPRLEAWLAHVFRVMGGYVLATGVLTVTLAATAFRAHYRAAVIGARIGGAASIGLMAGVNFAIGSDFRWMLL